MSLERFSRYGGSSCLLVEIDKYTRFGFVIPIIVRILVVGAIFDER